MVKQVESFLERIPDAAEIRRELAYKLRETRLLKQVLKLSEQRDRVREVAPEGSNDEN